LRPGKIAFDSLKSLAKKTKLVFDSITKITSNLT